MTVVVPVVTVGCDLVTVGSSPESRICALRCLSGDGGDGRIGAFTPSVLKCWRGKAGSNTCDRRGGIQPSPPTPSSPRWRFDDRWTDAGRELHERIVAAYRELVGRRAA